MICTLFGLALLVTALVLYYRREKRGRHEQ